MPEAQACAYCGVRRAVNQDHVVPRAMVRRYNRYSPLEKPSIPPEWLVTVPSCFPCNIRKGPRRLVPPSWEKQVPKLNRFFGGVPWRVWTGDPLELAYREAWMPLAAEAWK